MKRFVKTFITILCLFIFTATSMTAYAAEPLGETTVTEYTTHFDKIDKFIQVGEKIDISGTSIDFVFGDGSEKTILLDNTILTSEPDTSKSGLIKVKFNVYGVDFEIEYIVTDENVKMSKYIDLNRNYWGYTHIRRCVVAGIFVGISDNEFGILGNMTRAEFCQMLYNIYENDDIMTPITNVEFTDLDKNAWYYKAVMTCANAGIIVGAGDGTFNPTGLITRQDAAIMMMNVIYGEEYIDSLDYDETVKAAREKGILAVDIDDTSDYAKNSMAAALGVIYSGNENGELTPKREITRSECAALMSSYFFEGYEDPRYKPLVYLSPSNQMSNAYVGVDTTEGKEMQLVAEVTKTKLEEMGYEVFVSNVETPIKDGSKYIKGQQYVDGDPNIVTRAEEAKAMGADVYVAIHSNAVSVTNNGKYQGTTCFYNGYNKGSKELSQFIHDRLSSFTPTKDNGIKDDMLEKSPFAEVWRPQMANLIVEVEFHDYAKYAKWITENTKGLGECIALGIDDYFKSQK